MQQKRKREKKIDKERENREKERKREKKREKREKKREKERKGERREIQSEMWKKKNSVKKATTYLPPDTPSLRNSSKICIFILYYSLLY